MARKRTLLFVICCLPVLILGCRPTYTNENLEASIIKICKSEYSTDVKVKRVGRTVGIYLPVNGLFESTVKPKAHATLEDMLAGIKFTKEAADKMDNVSLVLSRAALSTNAPVDFYCLLVADAKGSGIQIVITRYVYDMKRLILGDVSRGDYVQRLLMDMDFSPVANAEQTVRDFFYDLQRFSSQKMIARYFSKSTNVRIVSSNFFLYLAELDYKEQRRFHVTDVKGIQTDKGRVLVKCRVKQAYLPAKGYEGFRFLYPPGFTNEYLLLLDTGFVPYMIAEIHPLYLINAKGEAEYASFPAKFKGYDKPSLWDPSDFFLEEIKLPDFLARQIANRIKESFQAKPRLKNKFTVTLAKGEYHPEAKKFKFLFDMEASARPAAKSGPADYSAIWKIVSHVMRRYNFNDYQAVELINIADFTSEVMTRQELLDKYWPKWLLKR